MAKIIRWSAAIWAVAAILSLGAGVGVAAESAHGQKFRGLQANPATTVIPPGRATINGTGAARTGSGAAKLGGPASATSGINGTTVRPKH